MGVGKSILTIPIGRYRRIGWKHNLVGSDFRTIKIDKISRIVSGINVNRITDSSVKITTNYNITFSTQLIRNILKNLEVGIRISSYNFPVTILRRDVCVYKIEVTIRKIRDLNSNNIH